MKIKSDYLDNMKVFESFEISMLLDIMLDQLSEAKVFRILTKQFPKEFKTAKRTMARNINRINRERRAKQERDWLNRDPL